MALTQEIGEKWVKPLYMWVTMPENWTPDSILAARRLVSEVEPQLVTLLLDEHDWRPRLVAGWFAGVKHWPTFTDQLGNLLVESELCYQGEAFAFALARFASDDAVRYLRSYLDVWLARPDRWYDQNTVMAALQLIDEQRKTSFADPYLVENGPWDQFVVNKPRWNLESTRGRLRSMLDSCVRVLPDA